MPKPSDHYRYEWLENHNLARRNPWRVRAMTNDGHTGSILNCQHPDCQALRDQRTPRTVEPTSN